MVPQFAGRCKHPSQRKTLLKEIDITSKILPGSVNRGLCEVKQKYTHTLSSSEHHVSPEIPLIPQNRSTSTSREKGTGSWFPEQTGVRENKSEGQDHA